MRRVVTFILFMCFTLVSIIPANFILVANAESYTENFEGSVDLLEHWYEKSAFGTTEWDERIVTDPDDSNNKVYKMTWGGSSPQVLKWNKPLLSYDFSVDLKGGGSYPKFSGDRAKPASVYLRTTMENLGPPEYEAERNDAGQVVESRVGHAGVVITLRDSWLSVEIKNSSNTYTDLNNEANGNWIYFTNIGNSCNTNFTNLRVMDDGYLLKIYWNNSLVLSIELFDKEYITYEGKGGAWFYTKAVVRNSNGEKISTISDARIAANYDATVAIAARDTTLYIDNVSLNDNFEYPAYDEDFSNLSYQGLWKNWTERCAHGTKITELDPRIIQDPDDSENMVYKLHFDEKGASVLRWKYSLSSYKFSADVKGGGRPLEFDGVRANPAAIYFRTTHNNLLVYEDSPYGREEVVGYAGVVFTLRNSWVSVEIKNSENTFSHNDNWFIFKNIGNNCDKNFNNLRVTDNGNEMDIYWNDSLLLTVEMSNIEYITYDKGSAYFYTKAVVKDATGKIVSTISDARIGAEEDATIALAARGTYMYVDNIHLEKGAETTLVAPEETAKYSGTQIRTALVPYRNKEGNLVLDDLRQGLRFCFDVLEIGESFTYNGRNYTVKDTGALVIAKDRLTDSSLMEVVHVGKVSGLLKQDSLIEIMIGDTTYKSSYIYNIPESNKDTVICSRAYLECEDANGGITYFYTPIQEKSLTSVYQSIIDAGEIDILDEDAQSWWK